jgi:O-antigen ligase
MPFFLFDRSDAAARQRDGLVAALAIAALFAALNVFGYDPSFRWGVVALALLIGLTLWTCYMHYDEGPAIPRDASLGFWAALWLWAACSLPGWAPAPSTGFLQLMVFSSGPLALLLGYWASERQWRYFQLGLAALAVVVCCFTIYQAFVLHMDRPVGFLGNWNTNSVFIGLILLPVLARGLSGQLQGKTTTLAQGLLPALYSFGMSLGQSRAALLLLIVAVAVLLWQAMGSTADAASRHTGTRRKTLESTALWYLPACIAAGFVLGDLVHGGALLSRFVEQVHSTAGTNDDALGSGRKYLWQAGWHMAQDRPWLGWGYGQFHGLYPQYRDPLHGEDGMFAHNDYLQLLLELGPIGLLLALGWAGASLRLIWRVLRRDRNNDGPALDDMALSLACITVFIHSAVDFDLYQAGMLILLGAYLGRLNRRRAVLGSAPELLLRQSVMTRSGHAMLLASLALLFGLALLNMFIGFRTLGTAYDPVHSPGQGLAELEAAGRFMPFMEELHARQANLILVAAQGRIADPPTEAQIALLRHALDEVDLSIAQNPLRSLNYRIKANLLFLSKGDQDEIVRNFDLALHYDPYALDTRAMYINYLERIQRREAALTAGLDALGRFYVAPVAQATHLLAKMINLLPAADARRAALQKQQEALEALARRQNGPAAVFTLEALAQP